MSKYFGGVLGGATSSTLVIITEDGKVIGQANGSGLNPWQVSFNKCVDRIKELLDEAKQSSDIPLCHPLESLGVSISGCEQYMAQQRIKEQLTSCHPSISKFHYVNTDIYGPLTAAFPNGGMILISGTGSCCQLFNPDNTVYRCGGWGHVLGDEGSAYWISLRAIKLVYDVDDGREKLPEGSSIDVLKAAVYSYFNIKIKYDILDCLYKRFSKSHIANFCSVLVGVARESHDPVCYQLFFDGGKELGKHVMSLLPQVKSDLLKHYAGVPVLLEGSVFKSWDLLMEGFIDSTKSISMPLVLFKLRESCSAAIGAAILGAKEAGVHLSVDFERNTYIFCIIKGSS